MSLSRPSNSPADLTATIFSPNGCPLQCKRHSVRDDTTVFVRAD